jgi:hypothetical protein
MFNEGKFCACCGMRLRTAPVRTLQSNDEANRIEDDDLTNECPQRQ